MKLALLVHVMLMGLGSVAGQGEKPVKQTLAAIFSIPGNAVCEFNATFKEAVQKGIATSIGLSADPVVINYIRCIPPTIEGDWANYGRYVNWAKKQKLEIDYTVEVADATETNMAIDFPSSADMGTTLIDNINNELGNTVLGTNFTVATVSDVTARTAPCKCIYDGETLPRAAWDEAGNPLFGTYCSDWNRLLGVKDHKDSCECSLANKCEKNCNFMVIPWCYVEDGCEGAEHTATGVKGLSGVAWSYDMCGAPDCNANAWDDTKCPSGSGCGNRCHCLFEGKTLPPTTAEDVGNPLYGTNCKEQWDLMPGTAYYDRNCVGDAADHCSYECNWHYAPHCFVEVGCKGLPAEDVVSSMYTDDLAQAAGVEAVGYSYAMCGSPNCYGDNFVSDLDCPFGEECLTCAMARADYKAQDCCGHPENHITIHHMYHEAPAAPDEWDMLTTTTTTSTTTTTTTTTLES